MRRNTVLIGLLLCCLALCAAAAASRPPAGVRVAECVVDDGGGGGSATFRGEMTAVPKTARMQMRFTLLEKVGAGAFEPVSTPGLTTWHRSKPGVKTFAYEQRVVKLRSGSVYRAQVNFRWLRADGAVVRKAVRRSGPCRQPGALPDLTVSDITWGPGPRAAVVSYAVDVTNFGGSTARNARVVLRVDGAVVDSSDISALSPGATTTVRFSGPACSRSVRATVDPSDAIRETDESDNALTRSCGG